MVKTLHSFWVGLYLTAPTAGTNLNDLGFKSDQKKTKNGLSLKVITSKVNLPCIKEGQKNDRKSV